MRHVLTTPRRRSPEYTVWRCMRDRCYNPNNRKFPDYGARGIVVCEEWRTDFAAFYADMGPRPSPRHTIERIDNDGPYAANNCRWATYVEQANNTRRNRHVWVDGHSMTLADAARHFDVPYDKLTRYLNGYRDVQRAVSAYRAHNNVGVNR